MKKDGKLFIKLGIEKDMSSGEMMVNIQFDENAPNFSKDKDVICWNPSIEEWNFVNEVFDILKKHQSYKPEETSKSEQNEDNENDFIPQTNEKEIVDDIIDRNKVTPSNE